MILSIILPTTKPHLPNPIIHHDINLNFEPRPTVDVAECGSHYYQLSLS